jgi:hypothetical protein
MAYISPWLDRPGASCQPVGPRQGPDYQNLHRNKPAMTLNLKDPKGPKCSDGSRQKQLRLRTCAPHQLDQIALLS